MPTFDGVWAAASLLHLPKARIHQALQEIRRVLKPDGGFFITVKKGEGEALVDNHVGKRFFAYYQPQELTQLLASEDLKAECITERSVDETEFICLYGVINDDSTR